MKRSWLLLLPVWAVLAVFFLAPLALMAVLSLRQRGPYGGLQEVTDLGVYLRSGQVFANYLRSLHAIYLRIGWRSLWLALTTTALCLGASYPIAYFIAQLAPPRRKGLLLGLVAIPFWTSFLIRTYAWMFILRGEGLLNHALVGAGLLSRPLSLLFTPLAVLIGLVYGELPFMVLPLYSSLEKLDRSLLEAAADLGAGGAAAFWRVTVPLSLPGIAAGAVLVFVPSLGQFVVSDLLGGARGMLFGNLIQNQFAVARDQPFAAALALELTCAVLLLFMAYARTAGRRGREALL